MTPELKQRVVEKVKESKLKAKEKLGLELPPLTIKYELTGWRAGTASSAKYTIQLNQDYLTRFTEDMLNQTIPHEVAHIVADIYYKRFCNHNKLWCNIMSNVYGLLPLRTHNFGAPLNGKRIARYQLSCSYCNFKHTFGRVLKNKIILFGVERFFCRSCKNYFLPTDKIMLDNG